MFTREEFTDIQNSVEEALSFLQRPFQIERVDTATVVDTVYDEAKYKTVIVIDFVGAVNISPNPAVLTKYGLEEEKAIQIEIPKSYLDREGKTIQYSDKIKFNGETYLVKKIIRNGEFPVLNNGIQESDYLSLVIFGVLE